MSSPARIAELVDSLDSTPDEWSAYLDRETGRVITLSPGIIEVLEFGEDDEDSLSIDAKWEFENATPAQLAAARAVVDGTESDRYLPLPDKFDFHEYRHIQDFIRTLPQDRIQDDLWDAIRGKGAFRRFKDKAERLGVINAWYAYRDEAMRRHMIDWAEMNGVETEEGPSRFPLE